MRVRVLSTIPRNLTHLLYSKYHYLHTYLKNYASPLGEYTKLVKSNLLNQRVGMLHSYHYRLIIKLLYYIIIYTIY